MSTVEVALIRASLRRLLAHGWGWSFLIVAVLGTATHARATEAPLAIATPPQAQGYLVYCPCMGRFGNQVDQLLGTMAVARASGRTLVLPPFIDYQFNEFSGMETRFIPFEKYFSVAAVREYVPAVTMEQFMAGAPALWPVMQRRLYCADGSKAGGCRMPEGNPHATFWQHFGVVFGGSASVDATASSLPHALSPQQDPVVAFSNAPGSYPVADENRDLQRYLRWNDEVHQQGDAFLAAHIARPFLAVHLRNGVDWQHACKSAVGLRQFMASPQCGLSQHAPVPPPNAGQVPKLKITQAMCLPGADEVVQSIRLAQQKFGPFRTVFVGTDSDDYRAQLEAALGDVRVVRGGAPQLDLYLFAQADLFIGNCLSSFSAFAVRERSVYGRRSLFFGFDSAD